jgi:uncharacterized integral membrane protein (TIGR00697 family)
MNTTKTQLYQILTGVFVACLLISNILASKTFTIGSIVLPTAVIIFPLVYIVNDVMAEIYGFRKARNIILLGFVLNLVAVISYSIAIALPTPVFATESAEAFAIVLGSTWRVLIASFSAYLVGSLVNARIMVKMKQHLENQLMLRCIFSTLIGEGLDALIFITIAFAGTMPVNNLIVMIIAQAMFKTVFEIICYPATRLTIKKINTLAD